MAVVLDNSYKKIMKKEIRLLVYITFSISLMIGMIFYTGITGKYKKVTATVTDIREDKIQLTYSYKQQNYTSTMSSFGTKYKTGEKIKIKINPKSPSQIKSPVFFKILTGLEGLFVLLSFLNIRKEKLESQKENKI